MILFKKAFAIVAYIGSTQLVAAMTDESDKVLKEVTELCQNERELEAEVLVKEQLTADPDNLELMTKLGEIQARLCNDQEAESTFRAVLVRDPNHESAVCGLGRLLDQALRTEEAEQLYQEFIQNNPVGHCALEDLCRILYSEERADEAFELARNQVKQFSDNFNAFDALRYLLHIEEDNLESELNDDRENKSLFSRMIDNLLEQIEMVLRIEYIDELSGNLRSELEDDRIRLAGEIENLIKSAPSRNLSVSEELQNRLRSFNL